MEKRKKRANRYPLKSKPRVLIKSREPPKPLVKKMAIINRGMIHEKILASQLNASIITYDTKGMKHFGSFIYLGPFVSSKLKLLKWASNRYKDSKIYIWWIGTDVYNALNRNYGYDIGHIKGINNAIHLAVSDNLKNELSTLGIDSEVLTLVPNTDNLKPLPLPEEYTVAVYMPSQSLDFYKYDMIKEVIKRTPDTKYILYGNKDRLDIEGWKNVNVMGWINDTKDVFARSSALLRLTVHDGFPKSIVEGVSMKRYIITNFNYPKINAVTNANDIVDIIKSEPVIDDEVISWYKQNLRMKNIVDYFGGV